MDALEAWAKKQKIKWNSIEELITLPEVMALYRKRIDLNSKDLARFETIKKVRPSAQALYRGNRRNHPHTEIQAQGNFTKIL